MSARQRRNSGGRSNDQLSPIPEQQSLSGDFQRSSRSVRYDARSSRSQSRSSVIDSRTPRSEMGDSSVQEKPPDELHEKTKDALSSLIVRKDELESNGIETEMMYKELMNCVSPWRRKKLQQEASDSQAALEDALRNADELMTQAKSAFEGYQSMHDPKRREAAAGDLFWKAKVMHKTLTACVQVACNAESARDQLAWADKMGKLMNTMMAIFRIMDELKQNLTKERALTSTLTSLMQKHGHADLFTVEGLQGCGEEADIALLLARAGVNKVPPPPPSFFQRMKIAFRQLPLPVQTTAAALVCCCLLWAMFAPHLSATEVVNKVLSAPGTLLRPPHQAGIGEKIHIALATLVYSLLSWLPGVCSSGQPVTSLWAIAQKFSPI